ncbi:MAG: hypothetical protein VR72_19780 [Clostridiaceae bacterium BRH_c20a]|nr:MAG: hypothetical protein VR72_19780 [Clostridiaceae bacterium BRH_c20a]
MNLHNIAQSLKKEVKGSINVSESMSQHTTWRIGGPADLFYTPIDWEDLVKALKFANFEKLPITVIGGGSNLLVKDEGIRGLVINICGLKKLKINGEEICAQGGVKLPYLASQAAVRGLTGLEFAAGIPGTVGGAVVMNAGAHGSSMSDVIAGVVVLDYQGRLSHYNTSDLGFTYRSSKLKSDKGIVIESNLKLAIGNPWEIKNKIQKNIDFRKANQPWEYPNAGSVFKNPPGDSAGRLIEAVGAKGWQIGGVEVSHKHANFFINMKGASCRDVLDLIEKVQTEVYLKFNILLEPEVLILGG